MTPGEDPPPNNMAAVRERAEQFAARVTGLNMTPLQAGYVSVSMSFRLAALQLRHAATWTEGQILALAEQLDGVADDTLLLGQAQTHDDPGTG
jgi:hypothetical protein